MACYIPLMFIIANGYYHEDCDPSVALKHMRRYYKAYEIISRKYVGTPLFFCWNLWQLLRFELPTLVGFTVWLLYFLLSVTLVMPVVCLGWAMIKLLNCCYRLAMSRDHWLCLAIVLTVTPITARMFKGSLSGQALWVAALSNGALCALLSEGLRRLAARAFVHLARLRDLATCRISIRQQYRAILASNKKFGHIIRLANGTTR